MKSSHILLLCSVVALYACGGDTSASGTTIGLPSSTPTPSPSPSPSPSPTPSATPTPSPTPTPTSAASNQQEELLRVMLEDHNDARAEVGVDPLVLDDDLNAQALAYAQELARTGMFQHSAANTRQGQGENLWAGTEDAFTYTEMAHGWIDEKGFYVHGAFPNVSNTGNWQDVGHYTQIIWRDTTRMGCGIATGLGRDWLVCRYAPPGNVIGQRAY